LWKVDSVETSKLSSFGSGFVRHTLSYVTLDP
jgi:hypothetical protein